MKLATMQTAMTSALAIRREAFSAFASRFRHLNQMAFPPMPSTGRGSRFAYGCDELLAVALVFQLGEAFVSPGVAVRIVIESWPELIRGLSRIAAGKRDRSVIEIAPAGLAQLGVGTTSDQGGFDITFVGERDIASGFRGRTERRATPCRSLIMIDAAALCQAVEDGLCEADPEAGRRFAEDLEASQQISADEGGVRLSQRDYFYQRAVELLSYSCLKEAIANERAFEPEARTRQLIDYLRNPLVRELCKRRDIVETMGEGFGVSLDALLALVGASNPQTDVPREATVIRKMRGQLAVLHEGLLAHAQTRARTLALVVPSAAMATNRRKAARVQ